MCESATKRKNNGRQEADHSQKANHQCYLPGYSRFLAALFRNEAGWQLLFLQHFVLLLIDAFRASDTDLHLCSSKVLH